MYNPIAYPLCLYFATWETDCILYEHEKVTEVLKKNTPTGSKSNKATYKNNKHSDEKELCKFQISPIYLHVLITIMLQSKLSHLKKSSINIVILFCRGFEVRHIASGSTPFFGFFL